ncbi:MAG: bifunctional 4-hydroxy-2-oxoglutarate aldolase/2-dehydro-3-deoxy-phosphogluconate aldolase [Chitinophagales bacterium]
MSTLSKILEKKIIAIIRGANPKDVLNIASALYEGGIGILEITMNSPGAESAIELLSKKMGDLLLIGAGTVLDPSTAKLAISLGAKFIISPNTDPATIEMTKDHGAISIPGAFTPNEIHTAFRAGGEIIKVFPAILGPGYIREILAPLPRIPLMPTGGINLQNIRAFLDAGAVAFGIGNSLYDRSKLITEEYLVQLKCNAGKFVAALAGSEIGQPLN